MRDAKMNRMCHDFLDTSWHGGGVPVDLPSRLVGKENNGRIFLNGFKKKKTMGERDLF